MRGIGVPSVLLDLITDLHTAMSARVRLAGRLSTPLTTTSGVRQGCVLAPALFCPAMNFTMEHDSHKAGTRVGQHTFTDVDYADDVTLFVDKEENFRTRKPLSSVSTSPGPKVRSRIAVWGRRHLQYQLTQCKNLCTWAAYSRVTATPVRIGLAASAMKRLDCLEPDQAQHLYEAPHIFHVRATHITVLL